MKGQRKTLGKRGDEEKHCKADPKLKLDTSLIMANEKEEWFIRITICITALYSDMATSHTLSPITLQGKCCGPG